MYVLTYKQYIQLTYQVVVKGVSGYCVSTPAFGKSSHTSIHKYYSSLYLCRPSSLGRGLPKIFS